MPSLRFVPTSATLHVEAGDTSYSFSASLKEIFNNDSTVDYKDDSRHTLSFTVEKYGGVSNEVRLTTEERFEDLQGFMTIRRRTADTTEQDNKNAIGIIAYIEKYEHDPAKYSVEVVVPSQQFDEVLHAVRAGRSPSVISVDVMGKGFNYGWEPDGSGREWDNKNFPKLLVTSIGFSIPIIPSQVNDTEREESIEPESLPPSKAQIDELTKKVEQVLAQLSNIPKLLIWLTAAVIVALIIWR